MRRGNHSSEESRSKFEKLNKTAMQGLKNVRGGERGGEACRRDMFVTKNDKHSCECVHNTYVHSCIFVDSIQFIVFVCLFCPANFFYSFSLWQRKKI